MFNNDPKSGCSAPTRISQHARSVLCGVVQTFGSSAAHFVVRLVSHQSPLVLASLFPANFTYTISRCFDLFHLRSLPQQLTAFPTLLYFHFSKN